MLLFLSNYKIFIIHPENNSIKLKNSQLSVLANNAFKSRNIFQFNFVTGSEHDKIAAAKGAFPDLRRLRKSISQEVSSDDVRKYGKKISADIIMVPVINITRHEDLPVVVELVEADKRGDYYWPALSGIEMQIRSEININMHIIDISGEKPDEIVTISHELTDNYDTRETFSEKLKIIRQDNIARVSENLKRKREEELRRIERDRRREKESKNSDSVLNALTLAIDIVDDLSGDSWLMLPKVDDKIKFKQSEYKDNRLLLEKDLLLQAFGKALDNYNRFFDGKTMLGNSVNGYGEYLLVNGDIVKSEWQDAKPNGITEYYYLNGSYFNGNFSNGFATGMATYKNINGNIYKGTYEKGKKDGMGLLFFNSDENVYYSENGFIWIPNYQHRNTGTNMLKKGMKYKVQCSDGYYKFLVGESD